MDDEAFEMQKQRLVALRERWHGILGMYWWRIDYVYDRNGSAALAVTTTDWRYQIATISWNMQELPEQGDEELEVAFVHELCHVMVNEMRSDREGALVHDTVDHEERVCMTLSHAFIWVRGASAASG